MAISPETYEAVMIRAGYCCERCGSTNNLNVHHRKPDHKNYREKWPLFIDSLDNLIVLCGLLSNNCHGSYKHLYSITDLEAEEFERKLNGEHEPM